MNEAKHRPINNTGEDQSLRDLNLDLNFVPGWARKPPDANYFNYEPRENRRERRYGQTEKGNGMLRRPNARPKPHDKRNTSRKPPRDFRLQSRRTEQRVEIPPVDIRFIPQSKYISDVVRRIQAGGRAHPIMEIASLFMANPASCNARIEIRKNTPGLHIFQCKTCRMITLDKDSLYRHLWKMHLDDFMVKEEQKREIPSGSFSCVAKCGMSGTLLGAPNHHSYAEKINEVHQTFFPNISLKDYKSKIVTIHSEETVEQWKQEYSLQTSYRPKGKKDSDPMSWVKAKAYFLQNIADSQIQKTRHASLSVPLTRSIEDRGLLLAIENAWLKEHRFPLSVMMALRGAFLSNRLSLFKTGKEKSITFVTPITPTPINLEYVVDSIKEVMLYLQSHPGSSRDAITKGLRPDAEPDSEEVKEIISPLNWLIDKGHIIEFFNGTLSVPLQKHRVRQAGKK
ncbi:hypothetical protein ACFLS1_09135 [Verrucomicrobiota bacterium]